MMSKPSAPSIKKWSSLEHKVWREFSQESALREAQLIVLVSGGKDSVALWHVLNSLAPAFGWKLYLAHVHHGGESLYRKQARDFCAQMAFEAQVPFLETVSQQELKTEADMRAFRLAAAKKWLEEHQQMAKQKVFSSLEASRSKFSSLIWLVTAHHADDLLETRLIRLLRGTGDEGLKAMQSLSYPLFRPLLKVSRREIEVYLHEHSLVYVEDPSNADLKYLRNWLRHQWLPALEKRQPGATATLARSLTQLAQKSKSLEVAYAQVLRRSKEGALLVPRTWWMRQGREVQQSMLAYILHRFVKYSYTKGHIEEIIKLWQSREFQLKERTVAGFIWGGQGSWLYARKFP